VTESDDIGAVLDEALQPPMANGEVLFEQPWQGRVFGMAVALHEAGVFRWPEFQASLINVIGEWDRCADDADPYHYYEHFQKALNELLAEKGLVGEDVLSRRTEEFARRPHGHDHAH